MTTITKKLVSAVAVPAVTVSLLVAPVEGAYAFTAFSRANCMTFNESITWGDSMFFGQGGTAWAAGHHSGSVSDTAYDGPNTILRARAGDFHISSGVHVLGSHVLLGNDSSYYFANSEADDCNFGGGSSS